MGRTPCLAIKEPLTGTQIPARAAAHKEESLAQREVSGWESPASSVREGEKEFNRAERYPHPPLGGSIRKLLEGEVPSSSIWGRQREAIVPISTLNVSIKLK